MTYFFTFKVLFVLLPMHIVAHIVVTILCYYLRILKHDQYWLLGGEEAFASCESPVPRVIPFGVARIVFILLRTSFFILLYTLYIENMFIVYLIVS